MKRKMASDEPGMTRRGRRPLGAARAACALLALLVLAGCGFHMQGASPLPAGVKSVQVSYHDNYRVGDPPLVTALKQRLRRQHLLGGDNAPAKLDIVSIVNPQSLIAVNPLDGYAAEYALTSRVTFNYSVNGVKRLSGQQLSLTHNYSVSDVQVLSDEAERQRMITGLQQELADMILERIAETRGGHAAGGRHKKS